MKNLKKLCRRYLNSSDIIQSRSFSTCSAAFYLSDAVMKALELKEYS